MRGTADRTNLDEILDLVSEDLVNVELDIYWAYRSGLDPNWVLEHYGDRIEVLHQKDAPASMDTPRNIIAALPSARPLTLDVYWDPSYVTPQDFVELGTGVLPIAEYVSTAATRSRSEFVLVEQDFTAMPEIESVRISAEYLLQIPGIESE
jgi:sugar phosphate isomerase/epimerase